MIEKLKEIKKLDLNCNIFSVYDMDGRTVQELLNQFFIKINETIDLSNGTIELVEYLVNEGLKEEIANKLNEWMVDGTLAEIINVEIFNDLSSKVNLNTESISEIKVEMSEFKENMTTTQSVYTSFEKKNIPFPKGVTEFEIWYKGDGSENMLKAVINYGQNKSTDVVISDNLKSTQWTKASVKLPSDVKAPIYLNKIYVSALNTTNENVSGSVYVDYLTARAAVGGGGMENTNINDYMEVNLSSLVGNYTSVTAFGNSKGIENGGKELISKMANKTRSMAFVGGYGISDTLGVPAVINQNKYTTNENEHFSFVTLSVSGGSLKSGNSDQWRYVKDYINRLSRKNVIVMMDSYLWSGISDKREVEALHDILKTASRQADKNIVVLSSVGESNYVEIKDGIRYINLAGVKSKNRQYIRFMGNDNELYYQFVDVK